MIKKLYIFCLCMLVVGFLWLLGGFASARASDTSTLTPRVFLPLAMRVWEYIPLSESRLGASDGQLTKMVYSQTAMDLFRAAGGLYNRTSVSWNQVEPTNRTPENYNWGPADNNLNRLIANGIEPFVLIMNNPSWAANTPCGPVRDPADLVEFVSALATRYPAVHYWALYNEVDNMTYGNGNSSGGCFGSADLDQNGIPDYADYAELNRVVWKGLHAANPNALLSMGQLSYDNFTSATRPDWYPGGCCFNYYFLGNLLGYMQAHPLPEGDKYADVLGFNDYLYYNNAAWQPRYSEIGVGAKAAALREVMAQYGQNFPLLLTEISGSSTDWLKGVSRETQARELAQMMVQGYFYDIQALIWWTYDDYPDGCVLNNNCGNWKYGLIDQTLAPKLSYATYRMVDQQLRGFRAVDASNGPNIVRLSFQRGDLVRHVFYTKSSSRTPLVFDADKVLITDMYGNKTYYEKQGNQPIQIQLDWNPVYVEINP